MKTRIKEILTNREFLGYIAAIAILMAVALAFFYPDAMQGNVLNQADSRQGQALGHETSEYLQMTGEKSWWTNSLFSGMPTFQISPAYGSHSLLRWIDTVMRGGLPAEAGYIFSMMFGFLIMCACLKLRWYYALIGSVAWGLSSYFIIIIGAGHLWKFFTLTYIPPVIGGIVLAYRGKWLAGTAVAALFAALQLSANHIQMTYYFAFLIVALVICYLFKAIGTGGERNWGIATICLIGAAVLAVTANLPSLYHTYKYSKETIRDTYTLLTDQKGDEYKKPDSGLDPAYITQYSYGRAESFTLLIPNVKGGASIKIENGRMVPLSVAELPEAQDVVAKTRLNPAEAQYLNYVSQYFGEPESTNGPVYVGAIICALFLLGCCIVRGPLKWSLLILTILSILLAMGRNCMWLTDFFIDYVPMYKNFRTPESILVVAEFTMPLLGILGLAKFMRTPKPFKTYRKSVWFAFGLPVFFCALGVLFPGTYGDAVTQTDIQTSAMLGYQLQAQGYPAEAINYFSIDNPAIYHAVTELRYGMIEADSWRSLVFIVIAFVALWIWAKGFVPQWVAISAIGLLIAGDLYTADKRYLNHDSFTTAHIEKSGQFPLSAADRQILADTAMNYRVMDIPGFWEADASYHHKTIGGYHAAKLTRYQDLIDRHLNNFLTGKAGRADYNVLDMLNARYIIEPEGTVKRNPGALGNAWFVNKIDWVSSPNAEMEALSTINPATTAAIDAEFKDVIHAPAKPVSPDDIIFETSYAPNRLTYHSKTQADALAVFSEIYFPWGWKATVDGKEVPIVRADYVLRAINIPAGEHTIEMTFHPHSVSVTVTWAIIAIVLIYLLIAAMIAQQLFVKTTPQEDTLPMKS